MGKYFGTDGFRGKAGEGLTADHAYQIGRFLGWYFGRTHRAQIVVGNSVELKNVILFDNVQTPHYNYVGDSILGYKSHMGAGSITSNVKSDKTLVVIKNGEEKIETGRKKMGAILGDFVEVGCNSVLNPGTILGHRSSVYPTSCVRGTVEADHIYKDKDHIIPRT